MTSPAEKVKDKASSQAAKRAYETELARDAARKQIAEEKRAKRRVVAKTIEHYEPEATTWLWKGRIPLGEMTAMGGNPEAGKSTVVIDILARVTRGTLEGEFQGEPRKVFIAATEDSWKKTIVPRLIAAGANRSLVRHIVIEVDDADSSHEHEITLPGDIDGLREAILEEKPALVFIETLMSRLDPGIDPYQDKAVRSALEPLAFAAQDLDVAMIVIVHFRKDPGNDPLKAMMGSVAIGAVCRGAMCVLDDNKQRVLCFSKNNLGPQAPSIEFRIEQKDLGVKDKHGRAIVSSRVVWGDTREESAKQILEKSMRVLSAKDRAVEWLEQALKGGARSRKEIIEEGTKSGHTESTLKRAASEIGVQSSGAGKDGASWSLPDEDLPF